MADLDPVFVQLLKKYIDNDTIIWDQENSVIRAGGISGVHNITVNVNPSDVGQCVISASGDVIDTIEDVQNGTYVFTVLKGGSLTIGITPNTGHGVERVNVDQVDNGEIESIVFEDIQQNHAVYVWIKEVLIQTSTDFLERSDNLGVYYSSLGACLSSLEDDYPDGLIKDVTINCIKPAIEIRGSEYNIDFGVWVSKITDWNKEGIYSLYIKGNNQYTINCMWLGGVSFENVDNVFISGITFTNYCNFSGANTPEEMSAIFFRSTLDDKTRNVAVHGCTFDGYYVNSSGYRAFTWRACVFKKVANIIIDSCVFNKAAAQVINSTDIDYLEIANSYIQGDYYQETNVSHSYLLQTASDGKAILSLCDNVIDGATISEYAMNLQGFKNIYIRRNKIKNVAGQAFSIGDGVDSLVIESNLFYNNINNGLYIYIRRIFEISGAKRLELLNNTIYMDGEYSPYQDFITGGAVDTLLNCNNIFFDPKNNVNNFISLIKLKDYTAFNNVYASSFYNNNPNERFDKASILTLLGEPEEGYFSYNYENRKLADFQAAGYEQNSIAIDNSTNLLEQLTYKLRASLASAYPANIAYTPEFDIEYKIKASTATVGAYNLNGATWDDQDDTSEGYNGINSIDGSLFTHEEAFISPSGDLVYIYMNNKKKNSFVKTLFTSQYMPAFMRYGKILLVSPECWNTDGSYNGDNNYTIMIETKNYELTGIPE